jgi:2'-hydroxyisoflavone reductase
VTTRRKLIEQIIVTSSILVGGRILPSVASPKGRLSAAKPLRMLILGGTGFIGPHCVHSALRRGHKVAVFSRGKTRVELPAQVELLTGEAVACST